MPTFAEMFETIHTWNAWTTAADGIRVEHRGQPTVAENYRAARDEHIVDPLRVLRTTTELIESLDAGAVRHDHRSS